MGHEQGKNRTSTPWHWVVAMHREIARDCYLISCLHASVRSCPNDPAAVLDRKLMMRFGSSA
jgi:hypothetical protein